MKQSVYDGCGIVSQFILKKNIIHYLEEAAYCVVRESENQVDCFKNRFGNRTMEAVKNVDFEKIKLSKLFGTIDSIHKEFYGRNIWLLLDE